MEPRTTVVVVNLESAAETIACLDSVAASTVPVRLVVVDNGSADDSADAIAAAHPGADVHRTGRNLGFAAAANRGASAATTPYVVFCNPDAVVDPRAVEMLERALDEHPGAAAVGPLVRNPDGSVQPSKRAFPTLWHSALHGIAGLVWPGNPGTRAYTLADAPMDLPARVDWVSGSCMAVRRSDFDAAGGFDESFFFFVEDVDLCKRFADAGREIWFEPRAEVVHAWGGSWTRRPLRFLWMHQRNLFRYATKHRRGAWVLAYPLIAAGLAVRFVLLALRWLIVRRSVPAHRGDARRDAGRRDGGRGTGVGG